MKNISEPLFLVLMIIVWIIYILPIMIASYRKCNRINGIAIVNILLGFTALGWIGSLVWAVTDTKNPVKQKSHSNWMFLAFATLVIGLTGSMYVFHIYNKPHEDIENAKPAYSMATEEIWKQYNDNLKNADSLYTGKVIELTGNLNRIDKADTLVYAVFVMEADSMFGDKSVRCEMLSKYNSEATALPKDASVKIKGFCTGFDQTDIKFNKCVIVK